MLQSCCFCFIVNCLIVSLDRRFLVVDTLKSPKMVCHSLYSQEYVDLLRQALEKAEADSNSTNRTLSRITREEDSPSSDEEEDNQDDSDSSSSSLFSQDNDETLETQNDEDVPTLPVQNTVNSRIPEKATTTMKRPPKTNQTQRQKKEALLQQMGTPPLLSLPLSDTQHCTFHLHCSTNTNNDYSLTTTTTTTTT
jgi:hypothetical protein